MKVLITRPRAQSRSFGTALKEAGLEPIFFPVIEIRPMEDYSGLDSALEDLGSYDWIVFTSANAVKAVLDRLETVDGASTRPTRARKRDKLCWPRVAAIGPKTAEALRLRGIEPSFVPDHYVSEAIFAGLGEVRNRSVLLPRAEIARQALPRAIVAAGGRVQEVAAYRTLPARVDAAGLRSLRAGVDVITFTSPSTVDNFVAIANQHALDPLHLPSMPKVACIGPITEAAARTAGFEVAIVAEEYTTEGLIRAIGNPAQ